MAADNPLPDVESALSNLDDENGQTTFLQALAVGQMIVPQMQETGEGEGVQLPYIEQEGTRYVVAFSSEQRVSDSGITAEQLATVSGAELAMAWPAEEELWLAINPGSEQGVALPPDAVRALPSLAGS